MFLYTFRGKKKYSNLLFPVTGVIASSFVLLRKCEYSVRLVHYTTLSFTFKAKDKEMCNSVSEGIFYEIAHSVAI